MDAASDPIPSHLVVLGCGYVGSAVAAEARARAWRVTALTRNRERAAALRADGIHVLEADLASRDWHAQAPRDAAFVLNAVSSGGGGAAGYRHSYVEGMRSVVEWARGAAPATFVYTSSTSVYPASEGATVDEGSPVGDGSETVAALLEAESLARGADAFRRAFILRLSGIYGPGRHHLLDQLRSGAKILPGAGGHRLNLIFRDDIVRAVFACFEAPPRVGGRTYNLSSDTAPTKREVVAWLARELGIEPPEFAGATGPAPPGPVPRRAGRVADRFISSPRIRAELGWSPQAPDFTAGYRRILATVA